MRLYQELEKGLLKKMGGGGRKTPSTTRAIKRRQHKNPTDMQEPKIYSSPFCEAPWLTATLEASPNSRYCLAALTPPLKADDKFTGAHISGLVAAVQRATPSSWPCHCGCSACPWKGTDPCSLWVQVCHALVDVLSDRLFVLDWCSRTIGLLMASQWKFCRSHTFLSGRKDSYWEETIIKKQICLRETS